MIDIDAKSLNELEQKIHAILSTHAKGHPKFRITEAATLCSCSTSKISKFVKKLGFENYKQYVDFLYGENIPPKTSTRELERLRDFIEEFDENLVLDLMHLIEKHGKIILYGYGPSLLCAKYFEYRLRTCTSKVVMADSDERSISPVIDENTLIIILTVTGTFHSFENIYHQAKAMGSDVVMVVEEYNAALLDQCDRIFWLAKTPQSSNLKAYEKSRTMFFIFLEEVVLRLQEKLRSFSNARFES